MSVWRALVDGLGSGRGMVDEAFGVEGSRGFAPYGLPMDAAGSVALPFAFTGEPRDGNGLSPIAWAFVKIRTIHQQRVSCYNRAMSERRTR